MLVHDALILSLGALEGHGVPEPRKSAVNLLSHALGLDWDDSHLWLQEVMTLPPPPMRAGRNAHAVGLVGWTLLLGECLLYLSLLERCARFKPLQYIVGRWDFHHLSGMRIRRPMLCPWPETEELAELVLSDIGGVGGGVRGGGGCMCWTWGLWVRRNAKAMPDIGLGRDGRGGACKDHRFCGHG
jgi:hypothetical protein